MFLTTYDLIRIVMAGGGLIIDLKRNHFTTYDLVRIAAAAPVPTSTSKKPTIIIKNPDFLLVNDMIRIAIAGRGSVVF